MKTKLLALGVTALISPLLAGAAPADPTDASIASAPVINASAYGDYAPDQDIKLQSWQAANAAAADAPGHAGHGGAASTTGASMHGGASQAKGPQSAPEKAPAPAAADEHAGHAAAAPTQPKSEKAVANRAAAPAKVATSDGGKTKAEADTGSKAKAAAPSASGAIVASGNVLAIDKANGKVKVTHDPIPQIGWPKMTMYFRVKDPAVLNQAAEGPAQFVLEKSGSGYVISEFKK